MITNLSDFEDRKENIVPLKRGRKAGKLGLSKAPHKGLSTHIPEEETNFENELKNYDGDDPLEVWIRYCQWIEDTYASGNKKKFMKVLERCTKEFCDSPMYKNDIRYLKKWIQYADLCADPKDVFQYLRAKEIGLCFALFWEAWAVVAEIKGLHADADKIYVEGTARSAQPLKRLKRSHQAFIARMARRALEANARSTPQRAPDGIDSARQRSALGQLPARRHVSSSRVPLSTRGGGLSGARPVETPNSSGFSVYVDDADADDDNYGARNRSKETLIDPWAEANAKENVRKADKWTDYSVPQNKRALKTQRGARGNGMNEPTFSVYEDNQSNGKPDLSRIRDTGTRIEKLAYEPALLYGEEYEECQFEEARAKLHGYVDSDDDEEEEDEGGECDMDQTMAVGPGIYAVNTPDDDDMNETMPVSNKPIQTTTQQAHTNPTDNDNTDEILRDLRDGNQPHSVSLSPLALLCEIDSPRTAAAKQQQQQQQQQQRSDDVLKTPRTTATKPVHTPGTAAQLAINQEAVEVSEKDNAPTVNTRAAMAEIDEMFNSTLPGFGLSSRADESESDSEDSINVAFNTKPAKAPLQQRKLTNKDVLGTRGARTAREQMAGLQALQASFNTSKTVRYNGGAAEVDEETPVSVRVRSGTGNEQKMLLHVVVAGDDSDEETDDFSKTIAAAADTDGETNDGTTGDFLRRVADDTAADDTFEIFCEPTAELRASRAVAATPLLSARALAATQQENAAPASNVDARAASGETFEIFEDDHLDTQSPLNDANSGGATAMLRAVDSMDDADSDGEGLINHALLKKLRKTSIGVALSRRYGNGGVEQTSENYDGDTDENANILGLETPLNMRRQQTQAAQHSQTSLERLAALPPSTRHSITADLARRRASKGSSTASTSISDSLERSPPTMSCTLRAVAQHTQRRSEVVPLQGGEAVAVYDAAHRAQQLAALPLDVDTDDTNFVPLVDLRPSCAPTAAQMRAGASLLELESCTLKVQRELTRNDDGVLLLVERVDDVTGVDFLADSTFALKVQARNDGQWERYIAGAVEQRLDQSCHSWLLKHRSLEMYEDAALMLLDHAPLGTLADALAAHRAANKPLGEPLAMYYTIELLKMLSTLHKANIIHGNICAESLLVRNEKSKTTWTHWKADTSVGGWDSKGLRIGSWSRAIDLNLYPKGTRFVGAVANQDEQRQSIDQREGKSWTFGIDWYGAACVAHALLVDKPLTTIRNDEGRVCLSEKLPSPLQWSLWSQVFDTLLNGDGDVQQLDTARVFLEDYLSARATLTKAIKPALCREKIILYEYSQK